MSFHVTDIALYHADGRRRVVSFKADRLNIITGGSKTGKSALIRIVDYCLGRNSFLIPAGVIRENVVWYVLKIASPNGEAIIGRPAPATGVKTNSQVFLVQGSRLEIPQSSELFVNQNTEGLIRFLNEFVGIAANINVPKEGHTREALTATISHSTFYLFQPQNRIADPSSLFYRQEDEFMPQAIKDTLPYFLGAASDDRYAQMQRLRRERRQLKLLERRLEESREIVGISMSKAQSLAAEAQQYGVLNRDARYEDFGALLAALREAANWTPDLGGMESDGRLASLREEREELTGLLDQIQNEVEAARSFAVDQSGFSAEIKEQKGRLESIGVYDNSPIAAYTCPLCNSELKAELPTARNIRRSLEKIDGQIDALVLQQPRLEAFISEKEGQLADVKLQLSVNKQSMEAIFSREQELSGIRERVARQSRVVGRVSLYLDSVKESEVSGDLERSIIAQRRVVNALELTVSDDALEEQMEIMLRVISDYMSNWAKKLDLEHSEYPYELHLRDLTVRTFSGSEVIPMREMGSGANWLGCHLIAYFGLHRWFIRQSRPVPRFLFLDQPTQAYFPSEIPIERQSIEDLVDDDKELVRTMFRFIYDIAAEMKLQVIVTDHANLVEPWFQESIVEEWRGTKKLVPVEWYTQG